MLRLFHHNFAAKAATDAAGCTTQQPHQQKNGSGARKANTLAASSIGSKVSQPSELSAASNCSDTRGAKELSPLLESCTRSNPNPTGHWICISNAARELGERSYSF